MGAIHGHSTMGGIEYDDRAKHRGDKKLRKFYIDAANQRAMEVPIK